MIEKKKDSKKTSSALTGRRLRELAVEATRHLDEVLTDAAGAGAAAATKKSAVAEPGAPGRSSKKGRASSKTSPGVRAASSIAKGSYAPAGGAPAKALVALVSPGAARVLAKILTHIGLEAEVADGSSDVKSVLASRNWDIVFAQGTPMPYPGQKISRAALNHCSETGTPFVLLSRRGERLVPEAAGGNAIGLLEWPFSAEKVLRALSEAIPGHRN
jgi:hypothetical protein